MRITDLLDARSVSLTSSPKTKSEALDQAVALMTKSGKINDEEAYRSQVYAREEESTTGIGEGIAIPHGKCDAVSRPGLRIRLSQLRRFWQLLHVQQELLIPIWQQKA